jgi:hypothetical protein
LEDLSVELGARRASWGVGWVLELFRAVAIFWLMSVCEVCPFLITSIPLDGFKGETKLCAKLPSYLGFWKSMIFSLLFWE